jgi:uncharacterized protein DUF4350
VSTTRVELSAVVILGVGLVALGVAYGSAATEDDTRASSFVDARRGLHALHLVLERCGGRPGRVQEPVAASDAVDRTLVVAAPSRALTQRETKELLDWVELGGRLVVVPGAPQGAAGVDMASTLLRAVGIADTGRAVRARADSVLAPALGEGLNLDWNASRSLVPVSAQDARTKLPATLVAAEDATLVSEAAFGERGGAVVVVADTGLFDNERLRLADNSVLAVRLLLGRGGDAGRVDFDEFHHGFRSSGAAADIFDALLSTLRHTWPGRALLVLAAAAGLALFGAAIRFGAPDPDPAPSRRALAEHAEALGRLLEKARARREALEILAAGTRRVVGPRVVLPASLSAAEFARRLAASAAPGAGRLAKSLERAAAIERGGSHRTVRDSELAAAAAELATERRRFLHGGG